MGKREYIHKNLALIWRSLKYVHQVSPNYILWKILTNVFTAGSSYIGVYMSAAILNELTGNRDVSRLMFLVLLTVGLTIAASLLSRALGRYMNVRTFQFWQDFGMTLNSAVASFDYYAMEDPETHKKIDYYQELLVEIGGGPGQLAQFIGSVTSHLTNIVMSVLILIEIAALGFFRDTSEWYLSWYVTLPAVLVITAITVYRIRTAVKTTQKSQDAVEDNLVYTRIMKFYLKDYLSDYHTGKDIRLYDEQNLIIENLRADIAAAENVMKRINRNSFRRTMTNISSNEAVSLIVTVFVGLRAISGLIGIGDVTKTVSGVSGLIRGLSGLASAFATMFVNNKCMEAFFAIIDTPNRMYQGTIPIEKRAFCDGGDKEYEIEFRNVSFKYPASDVYALRNVSLKFRIGERLAVVGMNGSGKTTFIKLLCRLYDPTEGEILLNGIDIRKYNYEEYMSIFSVVFQDFKLFSFSLGQNVAANVDYDKTRVEECLNAAGFSERLREMPQGLETCLYKDFEEDGVEISGGEAQKIALARALYRDCPFIILDEPTAALDPVAEYEIYSRFNDIVGDKTAIYISHRLSSCRFCNDIAVFDNGQLVQRGSHEELVADEHGKYHGLWYAQAQYYTE